MSNLNTTKSLFLLLGLTCLTTFFITCKNPVSDLEVTASSDFVSAPSEFRIFDASTNKPEAAMENVAVKISGPAAASIYNPGGKKSFVINNGIVQISFRRGTVVSETNPLKFNMEVTIPGYLTKIYPVTLYTLAPVSKTVFLVNLNNLPKGSAKISATTTTNTSGTTTSETIVTLPTNANKTEVAELTIPTGVTMKDKDGNPVTGTLAVNVLQFAGNGQQAMDAFGNKGDNTIKDINGNTLTETVIAPLGWLNINITAGGKEVKTFSSPVKAKIGIPAGLVNPITGVEYKEGDAISVLSKEDDGTEFKKEANTTLQKATDGSLFVEINITHLSGWTIAQILEMCSVKIEFPVDVVKGPRSYISKFILGYCIATYYRANGSKWYDAYVEGNLDFPVSELTYIGNKVTVKRPIENLAPVELNRIHGTLYIESGEWDETGMKGYNRFDEFKTGKINNPCTFGTVVSGPPSTSSTTKGKFRAKCTSGSTNYAILPDGYKLYYIKNADYSAAGTPGVTNAAWKSTSLGVEQGFNVCNINKNDLAGGGDFRFAILYNGRRYDYVQNIPAVVPDDINIELSIPCQ